MPGTDRKIFPEKVTNKKGEEKGGLLAPVGNPLGKALETGLSPIGAGLGRVTGPMAEGASNVTKPLMQSVGMGDRGELKEAKADEEPIGGKEQSGQNPLGL